MNTLPLHKFCGMEPQVTYLPDYDPRQETPWYGVKALWYEGPAYQGKKTKVFAYIGYPEHRKDEKVPAIVLVHGGGGHAYAEWIRLWNAKGFAAIAMDTTGYFPREEWKGLVGTEAMEGEKYIHALYGALEEDGYTVGPNNSGMRDCELPIGEQWMYHAVADTILANNILRADPRVDSERIGICGISWGSVITSIAIGYDNRYAFAIPIYGSAYLDVPSAPALPLVFREAPVKRLWSAADRLDNIRFPVHWLCWSNDVCFFAQANSLSYEATKAYGACLTIRYDFSHGHAGGWLTPESYRFAEKTLEGKLPFIYPVTEPEGTGKISFQIAVPEDFTQMDATILYLNEPPRFGEENGMQKMLSQWAFAPAQIQGNVVTGTVPENIFCYYVRLRGMADGQWQVSSSRLNVLR